MQYSKFIFIQKGEVFNVLILYPLIKTDHP